MNEEKQQKRNVPELRFPEFEGEWEEKKLGEVSELITKGTTPKQKINKGTVNFIKIENISTIDGSICTTNKIQEKEHFSFLKRSILKEGDLLFSIAGTIGRTAIVTDSILPANTNQALAIIRTSQLHKYFLKSYLNGKAVLDFIRKNPTIGAQPNISLKQVSNMKIKLPNYNEQQKIGTFFSKLDRQIELEEKKLALLEEQKKGYMQKIFSQELRFKDENGNDYPEWEKVNLEDVLKMKEGVRRGPFGGSLKKEIFIKEGYAVYEQANAIYDNQKFRYFIDENKFNEMENFSVKSDDIIMSCSGTIGKLSLIPKNYKEGIINQALIRFRVSEKLNSQYFLYYMKSGRMQRKILNSNPGSAIVNLIPVKELKKLSLKVPSIEEQEKISDFLNNLDSFLAKKQSRIKMIKNRKESFLQKMFL